ncbi:MAG: hypothetical protein LBD96_07015 [Treponema sp.]|nr:hypothetical protein [Treponema sp.]
MMMLIAVLCLLLVSAPLGAQEISAGSDSIPEALWRPQRGESPRYPRDLIIGSLARGNVSDGARLAATQVLSALVAGNRSAAVFSRFDASSRNGLFSTVALVEPRKYRLGEGREEADGSYSFLVRFIGREQGIAGELYVRFEPAQEAAAGSAAASGSGAWLLDDLLLEEQRPLGDFTEEAVYDLPPYERLF